MPVKASSWNQLELPNVVPDKTLFSFSKPTFINASQSTKFNPATRPSGKQGGLKSSATLFSHLLSPSVPKDEPPSMKLGLPTSKNKSRYTDDTRIKAFSPTLYNDPAFSPDPHANPFFTTSHDGWTSPPMVGHPTLKKDPQRPPHLEISPVIRDSGEFRLLQPPNSPMSDDGPPTNPSPPTPTPSPHPDTAISGITVATAARSQPASSLVQSHQASQASKGSGEQSHSPVEKLEKKRNPLGIFWRKSPPTSSIDKPVDLIPKHHDESPPSYETIFSNTASSLISASTRAETQSSTDVSSLSTKSTMTLADSQLPPGAARSVFGKHRNRRNKLDKIDELDESNPLGISVHHGGPYEAIQRSVQPQSRRTVPYNVGSQYPISAGSAPSSFSKHSSSEPRSNPPSSVSLNLSPGEILPQNHDNYYNPYIPTASVTKTPVPYPSSDRRQRLYPSREPNPQQSWDQLQQRHQEQIPYGSTHFPGPLHSHSTGLAPQHFTPTTAGSIANNIPARAVPSREGHDHDPRHDFHSPPAPPPPLAQFPGGGHEHLNLVHPSREGYTHDRQHSLRPPVPTPPQPPAQLPGDRHEHYNQGIPVHLGSSNHRQHDLHPPIKAPPPPPAAGEREHYNQVHPSREGYVHAPQDDVHHAVPVPLPPGAQLASGRENYNQGSVVHPSRGHMYGPQHDPRPSPPMPPPAQLPSGGHEHYNKSNIARPSRDGYRRLSVSAPPPPPAHFSSGGYEHSNNDNVIYPPNQELVNRVEVRPPMPAGQPQQLRDHDAQSTQRSNDSTFNSRNGAMSQPPPRHHVPKKLIMPAPLRSSLPSSPRDQLHLLPLHQRLDARNQPQRLPSRPSSPPSSNSLIPRAQDIPMSQGRKLRKQGSINRLPPSVTNNQPVSLPANVSYSASRPPAPAPAPSKTKVHKRLLSKRRTDL